VPIPEEAGSDFAHILNMPVRMQFNIVKLRENWQKAKKKVERIQKKSGIDIWLDDLESLRKDHKKHDENIATGSCYDCLPYNFYRTADPKMKMPKINADNEVEKVLEKEMNDWLEEQKMKKIKSLMMRKSKTITTRKSPMMRMTKTTTSRASKLSSRCSPRYFGVGGYPQLPTPSV